jgi:hypothetical protein
MKRFSVLALIAAMFYCVSDGHAQVTQIHGRVLDSRTTEPLAKATVAIRERKIETQTAGNGEFLLQDVVPGEIELDVTTVGYALVRTKITVLPATPVELEILLGPGVLRRTDEVTVAERAFATPEPAAVSDHVLSQADIRNLTSVLIDDPLRSVQSLPGVTTGDDFYAQFSARGAGFRSIGYATDGILLYAPMYEVGDVNDGGSLSMLNGDVVEEMTLSTGGFPSKYGDRTAGYLNIVTREGNRRRLTNTGTASITGYGWTTEAPLGKSRKASWLVSARKSYLDWIINKVSDDPSSTFVFGFKDVFAKLSYDPSQRHQFRFTTNVGNSRVDQQRDKEFGPNSFLYGDSRNRVATATWLWILSPRLTLDSAISYDRASLNNINHDRQVLFHSLAKQHAVKQDAVFQVRSSHKLETGYFIRRLAQDGERVRFNFESQQFVPTDRFGAAAWQPGAYVQDTITGGSSRLALTYGARVDHLSWTRQTVWMPRASAALSLLPDTKMTVAFGQYAQFPTFFQLLGQFENRNLRAERATHYTFQLEQLLNEKTRIRLEGYDREDRSGIYSADAEYRLADGLPRGPGIGIAASAVHLQNSLRGHARGVEMFVERRSVNKLSGWVSYGYGVARYRDAATNLSFYGDFDQRHTFNAYATYRVRPTLNVSWKYRYGSNFPAAAFLRISSDAVTLSDQQNGSRLPVYSRLDLRVNKAFNFSGWKLTVYGELLNALGHTNVRYEIAVDTVNRFMAFDKTSMFPRLPIVGMRVEF